jgi:glycosyltransferase involved in cell wall biosynthesis
MGDSAPMRVTFLTRSLGFGGAERQLVELAKALHQRGHVVTVAEFYAPGPLASELIEAGVPLRSLGKRGRWDLLGAGRALTALVRDLNPDIIHGYLVEPNIAVAMLKPLFPRLKVVWGIRASNMDFASYGLVSRASFATSVALSRVPDLIIANSRAGATYHTSHGYPAGTMRVVPNGIDTGRFQPDDAARSNERLSLGIEERHLVIGVMGRLDVMKDHPTFFRAARLFVDEHGDHVRFLVVGSGPAAYRERMRALVATLGLEQHVLWMTNRADAERALNACDVMTSASAFGEGFPNVVAEAMACGVPCVVTNVGDSAVIVGELGVAVPPASPAALAAAWTALRPRLGPALSTACRERIATQFSIAMLAERTTSVLRTILS